MRLVNALATGHEVKSALKKFLLYRGNQHLSFCDALSPGIYGGSWLRDTCKHSFLIYILEKMLARQRHSNKCPSHLRKFAQHLLALSVIKIALDNG